MRRLFVIFSMMFALAFAGCATTTSFDHSKAGDVYIDPDYTWVNNHDSIGSMFGSQSYLRSITLRVVNKKYVDVMVRIHCDFVPTKTLNFKRTEGLTVSVQNDDSGFVFGEAEKVVGARDDATFMVRGFARLVPDTDVVSCSIVSVK